MKNEVELLSPVGDFECLKAAVQNGANAVYFGASQFNARASATNFDFDELEKVINYCALRNVKTHLTLNILIKNHEFKDAVLVAKKAYELGIDALIAVSYTHLDVYKRQVQEILVEGFSKTNEQYLTGRTDSNKVVIFEGNSNLIGKMVKIKIVSEHMWYLKGEII